MATPTSIKLPDDLKTRIQNLAKASGRSAHSVMLDALEREVSREEKLSSFIQEALDSDADIEAGAKVYHADDVQQWLKQLSQGNTADRPKPWQK